MARQHVSIVVVAPARQRAACRSAFAARASVVIAGEGSSVSDLLALVARHRPAVALLGSTPGRLPSPLVVSAVRHRNPQSRVIFLTSGLAREAAAVEAALRGAHGWLHEPLKGPLLRKAVSAVARGEAWFPRHVVAEIVRWLVGAEPTTACGDAR